LRFFTLLSLFCYANLSLALGLGDAQLKSNLGENFLAKVNVTDIESVPDPNCFSATDIGEVPAFKKASVNLKALNGSYQLIISTSNIITEPIVNLRVSFRCEPNINREYVLLLDPAPILSVEKANTSDDSVNIEPSANDIKKQSLRPYQTNIRKSPTAEIAAQVDKTIPKQVTVKKVFKEKKPKKVSSVDERLSQAYTGRQSISPAPQSSSRLESKINTDAGEHKPSPDKPFLVVSTGNSSVTEDTNKPGLSLRLATEIDVSRSAEVSTTEPSTDTMDEVTVMSNRLAHLEKQIVSLQSRNSQLLEEAQKIKEENERFDWLKLLKVVFAILIAVALIEWLRRKFVSREVRAKGAWFDGESSSSVDNKSGSYSAEFHTLHTNAPSFDEPREAPLHHRNTANTQAISAVEKDDQTSIIEDAEVFIEHGRPTLAIQLLQNHLSESPTDSPAIWLKLLDLLSKEGTETEYDSAVIECNKYFNIKAAKFANHLAEDDSSIEDYPHIITRLEGVWGSPYAVGFLNDLIFNKRSQPREGLGQGAFNDLFFLKSIAKNLEYANSAIFKANTDQSNSGQSTSSLASQANVAAINIESTNFNNTLLTDIARVASVSTEPKHKFNDTQLGTKSNFNAFNDAASYEVSLIPHDEILLTPSIKDESLKLELPEKFTTSKDGITSLLAEEINFSLPIEQVEFASKHKGNILDEEIILDYSEGVMTDRNHHQDFSLELPNEEDKPKTKSASKTNSTKSQPKSNEIEWDLPAIEPEVKDK